MHVCIWVDLQIRVPVEVPQIIRHPYKRTRKRYPTLENRQFVNACMYVCLLWLPCQLLRCRLQHVAGSNTLLAFRNEPLVSSPSTLGVAPMGLDTRRCSGCSEDELDRLCSQLLSLVSHYPQAKGRVSVMLKTPKALIPPGAISPKP